MNGLDSRTVVIAAAMGGGVMQAVILPDWQNETEWRFGGAFVGMLLGLVVVFPLRRVFTPETWRKNVKLSFGLIVLAMALAIATLIEYPLHDWQGALQFRILAFCTFVFFYSVGLFFGLMARFGLKGLERSHG